MVAGLASDPHPRVLFAVADAIGNIAEVFDVGQVSTRSTSSLIDMLASPT